MAQTYATHRRFDPAYHFVLSAMLLLNLAFTITMLVRHHHGHEALHNSWSLVMALALILMALKLREYAVQAQNRIIRLEERLRLQMLLPEGLKARIGELREAQLIGLRFASDGELADRVREALDEHLGNEQIKKRIQTWRPDEYRV